MRIFEIMSDAVTTIAPEASAAAARQLMRAEGINHLVVTRGSDLLGILSARDIPDEAVRGRAARTPVEVLMHRKVITVGPNTPVTRAANLMEGHSIGALDAAARRDHQGIVTVTDLLRLVGRGAGRQPGRAARPPLRSRVPHRKQHGAGGAW